MKMAFNVPLIRFVRRRLFFLMAFLVSAIAANAQISPNPVMWKVSAEPLAEKEYQIKFTATIKPTWHLYDLGPYVGGPNATTLSFEPSADFELIGKPFHITQPVKKFDEMFGMEIGSFAGTAVFGHNIRLKGDARSAVVRASVEWMVCDDTSCLPPTDEDFTITIGSAPVISGKGANSVSSSEPVISGNGQDSITDPGSIISGNEQESMTQAAVLESSAGSLSLWSLIIMAVLWGFAALLTPCVFPMVPLTVSFFLKSSGTPQRSRFMAAVYGISIVALYTLPIAGIILVTHIVGGETVTADIFNWLATHWVPNIIFFLVFILFALSFFGAFEIKMPGWLINKSDSKADKGGIAGTFFLALTLVLVSFSCTGPIVGTVLIKSTLGEVWTPVITMLAFSVAFALPFTLFAFFPSFLKNLPKSGGWLNSVKISLGFLELALGLKFLSIADQTYHWGLLDREVYLALWIVIFSMLGFYLLGKIRFVGDDKRDTVGITRLMLSIVIFSFVVYMIPGMWGAPLKGISGYLPPLHTQDFVMGQGGQGIANPTNRTNPINLASKYSGFLSLPYGLQGFFDYDEALEYARNVDKPLFVNFTGHGCVNCREMEAKVWSDPQVLSLLKEKFVVLSLYSDDKKQLPESDWITTDNGKVLKSLGRINSYFAHKNFGVNSQPYYLILDTDGRQLVPGMGYNLDVSVFEKFLLSGLEKFEIRR